jgi:hypothetical protein
MRHQSYDPFGAELRRFADNLDRRNFRALSSGLGFSDVKKAALPTGIVKPSMRPSETQQILQSSSVLQRGVQYAAARNQDMPRAATPPPPVAQVQKQQPSAASARPSYVPPPPAPLRQTLQAQRTEKEQLVEAQNMRAKLKSIERAPAPSSFTVNPLEAVLQTDHAPRPYHPGIFSRASAWVFRKCFSHCIDIVSVVTGLCASLYVAGLLMAARDAKHSSSIEAIMQWAPVSMILSMGLLQLLGLVYGLYAFYWVFLRVLVGTTLGHTLAGFAIPLQSQKKE